MNARVLLVTLLAVACVSAARAQTPTPAPRDTTRQRPSVAPPDSTPSDDAKAVLRSIPEPLPPSERVAADTSAAARDSVAFASPDTTAADTSGVPTPSPTAPLGEGPGGSRRSAAADSTLSVAPDSSRASPAASAPAASPAEPRPAVPPPATPAGPDTCWRVQVAAPANTAEAASQRVAAESQLLIPMTVEPEQGRYKVRSRDCLTGPAAEALRRRAISSGFDSAFRIRMSESGAAVPVGSPATPVAKPKAKVPVRHTGSPTPKRRAMR